MQEAGLKSSYRLRGRRRLTVGASPALRRFAGGLLLIAFLAFGPLGQEFPVAAGQVPEASATRLAGDQRRTRFVADISRSVKFNAYVIPEPYRVVVDLEEVEFRLPVGVGSTGLGLIRAYRYGLIDQGRSRIVMDARGPILIEKAFIVAPENDQPARIVVDVLPTSPSIFAAHYRRQSARHDSADEYQREQLPLTAESSGDSGRETGAPSASDPAGDDSAEHNEEATPLPLPRPGKAAPARHRQVIKLATQGVRTIVIDPGHGGIDPGALGKSGTKEKEIVLAFAKELKAQLEHGNRYKVVLTRSSDTFVSLRDRVRIARDNAADLFIVVHADAVRNKSVRGATVYTLSEKASDSEAEELAHNENKSDLIAGVDLAEESDEIAGILIDLAQREAKNHASYFARSVVTELKKATQFTGKPLRSAGFRVLRAPDVPSVLLELGYLSHNADESQLQSPAWRARIAARVAGAIETYFGTIVASSP